MARYLEFVRGGFRFRRRIPSVLIPRFENCEIRVRLQCRSYADAKILAIQLASITEQVFRTVTDNPSLTPGQIGALARGMYEGFLADCESEYSHGAGKAKLADWESQEQVKQKIAALIDGYRNSLEIQNWPIAIEAVEDFLRQKGVPPLDRETPEFRQLCLACFRAGVEAYRVFLGRLNGDYSIVPLDPMIAQSSVPLAANRRTTQSSPKLAQFAAEYFRQSGQQRKWNKSTVEHRVSSLRLATELMGDRPLGDYTRADLRSYFETLARMPAKYAQSAKFRKLSARECIALVEADASLATLGTHTISKHYVAINQVFAHSVEEEVIEKNPVEGAFKIVSKSVPKSEREEWSVAELNKLFKTPIWAGCRSPLHRKRAGALVIRDWMFWLPLIAIFSGLRLNEIAGLHARDIGEVEGVTAFIIRADQPGKTVKTASGERDVPIHPTLVRLGLFEHVAAIRKAGQARLWPELKMGGADSTYGAYASKRFGAYFKYFGFVGRQFHGLRHTALTTLGNSGVDEMQLKEVGGHVAASGETARYYKGATMVRLKATISRLEYQGLDLSHIG